MATAHTDIVCDEARVRAALAVIDEEKRRLASELVMALTPTCGSPTPEVIHQAAAAYCEQTRLVDTAREGLHQHINKNHWSVASPSP